jgi:hypothetical protein
MDKRGALPATATALAGADAVIGFVALVPVGLAAGGRRSAEPGADMLLAGLMFLALVAWSVLVVGTSCATPSI